MSDAAFSIRRAAADDLESLIELYRHFNSGDPVLAPARAEERFTAMLAQPGMSVFIGFLGAAPTSTVTLIVIPNLTRNGASYALIENVVTHGDYRKRGHAGALIRHAVDAAWDADCYKVMLLIGSKDPSTLRFYENCGFVQDKTGYQIRRQ
ncbi:GNAT family N-acetyltransferase [Rhizobium sp. S96]|uniref:GNAT family N-acetyltransferase n=1 Tax=Rhizobium sp. S96 TaxID=3055140 RepID=UPI0025AA9CFA|nr:GNAT family N-acetyltransferase [Rhizobium sp. S96]MDM9621729.1 GNAT family N-acetyltransferase [Rhizobium sp. S96]